MDGKAIRDKVILALDVENKDIAEKYLKLLEDKLSVIKIGSYLYTQEGPDIVKRVHDHGMKVFLDLKFHDIPHTVAKTARIVTSLGVYMFTIHTSGGKEMMRACKESVLKSAEELGVVPPKIVGVTVLSSIDDKILKKELKIGKKRRSYVKILSAFAFYSGLDGVVASGEEIKNIKKILNKDFLLVVPGIRPSWFIEADDQKKALTPKEALALGADYLVIGRPVLKSPDPRHEMDRVYEEILHIK
ncbi:orotidine-5'-phosphate decarboxylase [Candidatus Desantisbacteria bacterium]|nr:orotidine-5'-phosphate decarboxylase [Candidatus Desantisbacteria bacterium]